MQGGSIHACVGSQDVLGHICRAAASQTAAPGTVEQMRCDMNSPQMSQQSRKHSASV